ncbi:hypothetical protein [Streptomyces boninensis]|uniref:hypothetical protein n=1 Tax=Streptomyces boninensis TaxID=2039455 RepID=UPI003B225FC1
MSRSTTPGVIVAAAALSLMLGACGSDDGSGEKGTGSINGAQEGDKPSASADSKPARVVTTVILSRPEVRNAVDGPTAAALASVR